MDSKFKVGDKVMCVSISDDSYREKPIIGEIYTILKTSGKARPLMEHNGKEQYYEENDFVLVNKNKGSRYNSGKLRWRNVPMFLFEPVVAVGAAAEKLEGNPTGKYPTYNFLQGLSVADCMDSLKRHLCEADAPDRPDIDPEDNQYHLAKVAWNALIALHYIKTRPDLDDRYKEPLEEPYDYTKHLTVTGDENA